ncbi:MULTISPECIES: Hpt domain-containing protein [unclassified Butyrivibrio]|uniref:Hpt domain-containing protein n=1 Tax=unclassified Butyrivibrio TaxID=2639466 RepID=UPI0003B5FD32|nr:MULTISPECIES: Hpt domain-containing protein [unclassified Butyrivibrio]
MELPESLKWINEVEDIDPAEGMRNCGQPQQYIKFIRTFFDTLENRIKEIRDAFDSEDIKTYTIKVHSLKSTARIMGAKELSNLAEELEHAGDENNREKITDKTPKLLEVCASFKEKLSPIESINDNGRDAKSDKPFISESELAGAYAAIAEFAPQMDYEAVEMVLSELNEYKLPPEDEKKVKNLEKLLRNFDWGNIEAMVVVK